VRTLQKLDGMNEQRELVLSLAGKPSLHILAGSTRLQHERVTYCSWRYSSKTERSFSAGAHSEEDAHEKVLTRRERAAAMERKREEFIIILEYCCAFEGIQYKQKFGLMRLRL
jgi:hypothetical protein